MNDLGRLEDTEPYGKIFFENDMPDGSTHRQFARDMAEAYPKKKTGLKKLEEAFYAAFDEQWYDLKRLLAQRKYAAKQALKNVEPAWQRALDVSETLREKMQSAKNAALRAKKGKSAYMFRVLLSFYVLSILAGVLLYVFTFEFAFPDLPTWIGIATALPATVSFSFLMKEAYENLDARSKKRFLQILIWTGISVVLITMGVMALAKWGVFDTLGQDAMEFQLRPVLEAEEEKAKLDISSIAFAFLTLAELLVASVFGISTINEYHASKHDADEHQKEAKDLSGELGENDAKVEALAAEMFTLGSVLIEGDKMHEKAEQHYATNLASAITTYKKRVKEIKKKKRSDQDLEDYLRKRQEED